MDNISFSNSPQKHTSIRLKILLFSPLLFFALLCSPVTSLSGRKEITPERDISVVRNTPQSPDWKILWDGARNMVREGHYDLAADVYGQLFSIKPNIEEANWEYCKVLLQTQSYQIASKIISLLLEKNPTKNEYLLVAGQVAAQQKKFAEAERYFGLIFEKAPIGEYGDAALEGFAYSLRSRGHKDLAFPLMQQLTVRKPNDSKIIHDFAVDAIFLKRFAVARALYRKLLTDENADDTVVFEAVAVFTEKSFEKEHVAVLKRYLSLHPGYMPFRTKLMTINERNGEYEALMAHLSFLIENSEDKKQFLLRAAQVAKHHLKRPDKALGYLERLRPLNPDDSEVITAINELQVQLARDFLSIVENGGAALLWNDLVSFGANRQSIFHRMSVLLEKEKKYLPLIDVLEVLFLHGEKSVYAALKLAQLLHKVKKYERSQHYLVLVADEMRDGDFYHLKADNEIHLGFEMDSLYSLMKALEYKPTDVELREQCIELAGRLGLVEDQIRLFNDMSRSADTPVSVELVKVHVQLLTLNQLYDEALNICDKSLKTHTKDPNLIQLYLLKAEVLRKSGRTRSAEQLLRQLLHEQLHQNIVLDQLIENAIIDNDVLMAKKWLNILDKNTVTSGPSTFSYRLKNRKRLARIRLFRIEGEVDEAFDLIHRILNEKEISTNDTENISFKNTLMKEKCYLYLATGDYSTAEKLMINQIKKADFDAELFVLYEAIIAKGESEEVLEELEQKLRLGSTVLFSRVLSVVGEEIDNNALESAKKHLASVRGLIDNSVRMINLDIKLSIAEGKFDKAKHDLKSLEKSYKNERLFCREQIEIMAQNGKYQDALKKYEKCFQQGWVQDSSDIGEVIIEDKIFYARLLWRAKKFGDSLEVYEKLLDPPVYIKLIEKFKEKRINYQYLTRHQSFWNSMMLLLESDPDIIAELMEPTFLFDNIGNETGKIVSDNFEQYSWQEIIENEFLARKASFNKNYHFAVKSYEKLLEREETTESKVDLATIYGRIGKFRKEAQVYEDISTVGEVTPELQESIKRNILQIRPTNTIDVVLDERSGRGNTVDIRKTSLGTTFWFTPDLDKDFWLNYTYNKYESTERKRELDSNLLRGAMTYEFSDNYEFTTGLGAEKLNDSSESEIQYNFELKGQLDDYVSGFVLFEKAPIDDTVEAMEDGIFRQFIQTGLTIETELGVTFGGDLRYSMYSDDNEQNRFYWFSSYSIFGETLQLDFRYAYQYLANKDVNGPEGSSYDDTYDDFIQDYWSPETFSEHRLGLQLKKDFFGYLTDVENKMSYFRFDTGISLEDEENIAYSARFDIFLEMSPHLLLKGNFSFNSSDVYDEKMLSLSLHYSW